MKYNKARLNGSTAPCYVGPLAYFSGPFGWQIAQSYDDPIGIWDVRKRWLPEFDKPLGEARGPVTN